MYSTEGIVLAVQRRSDTTSLIHVYTREFGRIVYMVYGGRGSSKKKKGGVNMNILTPMSWLDIEGRELSGDNIHLLCSAQLHYVSNNIQSDVKRQCLAMFMSEALYKTLKHPLSDERVFYYLCDRIVELDSSDSVEHISDAFVCGLSELLGYGGEPMEEFHSLRSAALLSMFSTT
ncbi:MAG: recombination protein O N-terminal domain-containing protein [Paludibacteraceae bacterium]|nr:recombination protein O N-terminal domain-containing protein [Paludibacteraceae bacterium]